MISLEKLSVLKKQILSHDEPEVVLTIVRDAMAVDLQPNFVITLVEICNIIECSKMNHEGLYPLKYHSLTQYMILEYIADIKK